MLIYIIPEVFPNKLYNYSGQFVLDHCKVLKKLGHDVVVLDSSSLNYKDWFRFKYFQINDKTYESINILEKHYRGFKISNFPKLNAFFQYKSLKKLYKKAYNIYGKPDLVISHFSITAAFNAAKICSKNNIKLINIEHNSLLLKNIDNNIKSILKKVIDNTTYFVCVSEHLKESIIRNTKTKKSIEILHNFINPIFKYINPPNDEIFKFLYVGNLYRSKGVIDLINCFYECFKNDHSSKLYIIGDGEEKNNINDFIKSNKIRNIILKPSMDQFNLAKEYANCNCFVSASPKETFGIAYREAMAVGRPILAIKNMGISYAWKDDYGILCENLDKLKKGFFEIKSNYYNYNLKGISSDTLKSFGVENYSKKLNSIINGEI